MTHPAGLGGISQQGLHHRERDQLRIAQPGLQARRRPPRRQVRILLQRVIGSHIECGREGVYVVRHTMIVDTLASCPQLTPWHKSSNERERGGRPPAAVAECRASRMSATAARAIW
jgi:hypothetical protein